VVWRLIDYLVGTGGWAYFIVAGEPSLKAYSQVFNFVEVNHTFYEYPETRMVERWRKTVPKDFTFALRCHQDLTHRIGLKPVDEAYYMLDRMIKYCRILEAPFLVMETPSRYAMDNETVGAARDFLGSVSLKGVRLVWEIRTQATMEVVNLMQDFSVVHCVDLSRETPKVTSDVVYSRLFGKGQQNIYQFTDEELLDVDERVLNSGSKVAALSYHGVRMNSDAARFVQYKKTGKFMPVTKHTGVDSFRAVLAEDARFPLSKTELLKDQGWKVVDITSDKRVHLSELLANIPEKKYADLTEVVQALEAAG
jgi:uncharacterized protein YecE (DUF72 family)